MDGQREGGVGQHPARQGSADERGSENHEGRRGACWLTATDNGRCLSPVAERAVWEILWFAGSGGMGCWWMEMSLSVASVGLDSLRGWERAIQHRGHERGIVTS